MKKNENHLTTNNWIIPVSVVTIVLMILLHPVTDDFVIVKEEVTSIQPFAGKVNGHVVGTKVMTEYWITPDSIESGPTRYYVLKPWILGKLGYIYKIEKW